jgi:transposase
LCPHHVSPEEQTTRPALERNEQDREDYKTLVATHFRPEQLVFADESHFNRLTLRRPYAWSIRGKRACRSEFSYRGTKYSILPALSLDGILHLEVVENAITGDIFRQFVQGLLPRMNRWPLPHSVLIVDNAAIHKVDGIREMVEGHGARLLYLPAYSPDLNPIELAFSSIKAWLRAHRDRVNIELNDEDGCIYNIFWEAVYSVTAEHARGWYKHCGYQLPR